MAEKGRECKLNFKIQYKSIYSHILEVSKQEQPKARKLAGNGQVQKINQNKYPKKKEKKKATQKTTAKSYFDEYKESA